jgi:predicted enzyme related to lactoylglutathione lyase
MASVGSWLTRRARSDSAPWCSTRLTRRAKFYGELLAAEIDTTDPDWCEVHLVEPRLKLAFQRVEDYQPPEWPNGLPQQAHLDVTVVDLQATSRRAVELGAAVLAEPVVEDNATFQVHADPCGHPFCLCVDG